MAILRHNDHRFGEDAYTVRTSFRGGPIGASYSFPMAKLTVDDTWLRVKGPLWPAYWISRDQVGKVVRTMSGTGFKFIDTEGRKPLLWVRPVWVDEVLGELERRGWPVGQSDPR